MDIFDFINFAATLVIAGAASTIAWNINKLAQHGNVLSEDATRLVAYKQLLDWARRVLAVFSPGLSRRYQAAHQSSLD